MLTNKLENLTEEFRSSGGCFKIKKLKELFSITSTKKVFNAQNITLDDRSSAGTYPYVVRSAVNNGIRGFTKQDLVFLNPKNTLSFAQDTFMVFYQKDSYFTGNNVKVLVPRFSGFNDKIGLYLSSNFNYVLKGFTWGQSSSYEKIASVEILVPMIGEYLALNYMERYVEELEAYLKVTGLKDYKLTEKDEKALNSFNDVFDRDGGG